MVSDSGGFGNCKRRRCGAADRIREPQVRRQRQRAGASGSLAAETRGRRGGDGIHGAVLEAGMAGSGAALPEAAPGASALQSRAKRRQNDFGKAKRLTRHKQQFVRDRLRLRNHLEALLEQARIKLSSAVSDLLGQRGRRTPRVLAAGET